MFVRLSVIAFILCLPGCVWATDGAADDEVVSGKMYAVGGVMLLISLVVLVALCADEVQHVGIPAPSWSNVIQIVNSINTGFRGNSDGLRNVDPNTVQKTRTGTFEADGAKWGEALSTGKHLFEIYWPRVTRGTLASVGVGTAKAPLLVKPKDSLVGCNEHSWGLDIARFKCLHRGKELTVMPKNRLIPDTFLMYVDCDSGTLGFGTPDSYWGAPIHIPKDKFPVYPMVGIVQHMASVTMRYKGSALETVGDTGYGLQQSGVTSMVTKY